MNFGVSHNKLNEIKFKTSWTKFCFFKFSLTNLRVVQAVIFVAQPKPSDQIFGFIKAAFKAKLKQWLSQWCWAFYFRIFEKLEHYSEILQKTFITKPTRKQNLFGGEHFIFKLLKIFKLGILLKPNYKVREFGHNYNKWPILEKKIPLYASWEMSQTLVYNTYYYVSKFEAFPSLQPTEFFCP